MALTTFAMSFCYYSSQIDIHLHDTYFIIPVPFLLWTFTLFLLLFWALYHITFRFLLSTILIWLHMIGIVILFPLTIYTYGSPFLFDNVTPYDFATWEVMQRQMLIQTPIVSVFVMLHALYLVNLTGGVVKVVTKSSK